MVRVVSPARKAFIYHSVKGNNALKQYMAIKGSILYLDSSDNKLTLPFPPAGGGDLHHSRGQEVLRVGQGQQQTRRGTLLPEEHERVH